MSLNPEYSEAPAASFLDQLYDDDVGAEEKVEDEDDEDIIADVLNNELEVEEQEEEEIIEAWRRRRAQSCSRRETPPAEAEAASPRAASVSPLPNPRRESPRSRSRSPIHMKVEVEVVNEPESVIREGHRGRNQRGLDASRGRGRQGRRASNIGRRRPAANGWQPGRPLQEIYVSDDDVPDDLRDMVAQVRARREARQREAERRRDASIDEEDEEFFEADDGGDAALFCGEEGATHFEWRTMESFNPVKETFLPQKTGPTTASKSPYEAFRFYWTEDILSHIVSETNRYAATKAWTDWYDTNVHEIFILFSFWMMFGIIRMPSTKACFSEHYLLRTDCFRLMFSRNRYERLCTALCFNDNALWTPESSKLFPIEPILTHLNSKFQGAYIPRQEICIDESLTLWKGNLSFRQYIKTKAAKFGIKTFELCESATGYLWSFFVYTGKDSTPSPSLPSSLLKSTASVLRLVTPLLGKGYTLFMDNWFNSPLLARFLKRNKTDVVGSLRTNRQHVPTLISRCDLQPGQFVARHSEDMMVMAYHDRKKIALLSTCHGTETALAPPKQFRSTAWKPQLVLDYNRSMGGVDMKDGMLESYLLERKKCLKWHMKLFKRLLNCSILNARIVHEASTGHRHLHIVFRLELVDEILKNHLNKVPKPRHTAPRAANPAMPDARFTDNNHWPSMVRSTERGGRTSRRRCTQCKTKKTVYECSLCDVGLCVEPCFGNYHTRP